MRGLAAVLISTVIVGIAACGDESGDSTRTSAEQVTTEESTTTDEQLDAKRRKPKVARDRRRERAGEPGTAEPETQSRGEDQRPATPPKAGTKRVRPNRRAVYETGLAVCRAVPPKQIARNFGIDSSDPVEIARLAAEKVIDPPRFREAAFEGCLAGFGIK